MEKYEEGTLPKKGELFGVKLDLINKLSITNSDESDFQYNYNNIKIEKNYQDKYLLFMYLGDGLAREYYTSLIFNVIQNENNIYASVDNYKDFLDKYKRAIRYPLLVVIDEDSDMYQVDTTYYKSLLKNKKEENNIKRIIQNAQNQARNDLENKMNDIAKNEDVYNLKKTLN